MKPAMRLEAGAALPRSLAWLAPSECERLAALRLPRRRNDFRRGRWTAKRTLARALGVAESPEALAEIEIRADENGAPFALRGGVPLPCDLSLSHRAGAALCALGPVGSRPGCDIEWIEPRSRAFSRHFLSDDERRWLDTLTPGARHAGANLLWSAKESAVKSLRSGLDVDVRRLHISFSPDDGRAFRITVPGVDDALEGRWGRYQGWIWTAVSPRPDAFPARPPEAVQPLRGGPTRPVRSR